MLCDGTQCVPQSIDNRHADYHILCDSAREKKCSNYLETHSVPKENSIVTVYGEKTRDGDAIFVNNMKVVDEMIYMNLRDLGG